MPQLQRALLAQVGTGYLERSKNKNFTINNFNTGLETMLGTKNFSVNAKEFELLSKTFVEDPSLITAFAIAKSEGKSVTTQADLDYLVDVYTKYKKTLFYGSMWRITAFFTTTTPTLLEMTDKKTRLAKISQFFLDPTIRSIGWSTSGQSAAALIPQETLSFGLAGKLNASSPNYWDTTAISLKSFMVDKTF